MSLSCSVNFVLAGAFAFTVPQFQVHLGQMRLLYLFALVLTYPNNLEDNICSENTDEKRGLDALAVILVWLFMPGTSKSVTLAEFNYIFGVPTRLHIKYQF